MCVAFEHKRELWCNMRNVPKIPQRHCNTHVSFITVFWSLENCLPTACPKCFIPPIFSIQTYHSVFSGFTWLCFHMIDWRYSWGNAHLAVFKCVITKLVGATYYQQSTCFLPSYFVKATVLPSEMTKICPFFLYVARASCICENDAASFTWLLFFIKLLDWSSRSRSPLQSVFVRIIPSLFFSSFNQGFGSNLWFQRSLKLRYSYAIFIVSPNMVYTSIH